MAEIALLIELPRGELFDELTADFFDRSRDGRFYTDGQWTLLHGLLSEPTLVDLVRWLEGAKLGNHCLVRDGHHVVHRIAALPTARCHACDGKALRYLPGFAFGAPSDQIACETCGGMFDVDQVLTGQVMHLTVNEHSLCFDPMLKEKLIIGRSRLADLQIAQGTIARHHAVVRFENDGFVVLDLGGTNGTLLNGEMLPLSTPTPLADGDELVLPFDVPVKITIVGRA